MDANKKIAMVQISKQDLDNYSKLPGLLKKASQVIKDLEAKVQRHVKSASLKLASAEMAAEIAIEIKEDLQVKGVAPEVAEQAAAVAAEIVQSAGGEGVPGAVAEEAGAVMAPAPGIDEDVSGDITALMDEVPADVKGNLSEMLEDEEITANKVAKLMIPILKKIAKKKSLSSHGSLTGGINNHGKEEVSKSASLKIEIESAKKNLNDFCMK